MAEDDRAHFEAEKVRLLYVALTRACERLVVVHAPSANDRDAKHNRWYDALANGWGYRAGEPLPSVKGVEVTALHPPFEVPDRRSSTAPEVDAVVKALERFEAFRVEPLPQHGTPSSLGHADSEGRSGDAAGRTLGRAVGTLVHALLERADLADLETWTATIEELLPAHAAAAAVEVAPLRARTTELLESLAGTAAAVRLAELASGRIHRELPLLLRDEEGVTWSGAIDLLAETDAGWVVADHKTDRGIDAEQAVARYGDTMRLYGRAVAAALGLQDPPRLELLLLERGEVAVVPQRVRRRLNGVGAPRSPLPPCAVSW